MATTYRIDRDPLAWREVYTNARVNNVQDLPYIWLNSFTPIPVRPVDAILVRNLEPRDGFSYVISAGAVSQGTFEESDTPAFITRAIEAAGGYEAIVNRSTVAHYRANVLADGLIASLVNLINTQVESGNMNNRSLDSLNVPVSDEFAAEFSRMVVAKMFEKLTTGNEPEYDFR